VPVLGYLDDLVIVPAGLLLAIRLIPEPVMADCRQRASALAERPISRAGLAAIVAIWLAAAALTGYVVARITGLV
jgi:hypothetical protein